MSNKKDFLNKTKLDFYKEIKKYQQKLKPTKEIEGYGSAPIVGEKGYPYLATHNISNEDKNSSYRNTSDIVKKDYKEIIPIKAKNILGSTDHSYAKKVDNKILEEIRDVYKSKKDIQVNTQFEKELTFNKVLVNKVSGVVGSKNPLESLEALENTPTEKIVEKFTNGEIKSREAIITLYERGINEHQIINLLALGSFGVELNKKLVPTRWAITAYDQTIEKYLHKKIIQFRPLDYYELYTYEDKGNSFVIILIPDTFSGEVIEQFDNTVEKDYVGNDNKLNKEEPETAGGFFATKIGIFEQLTSRKRQASFISIRIIKNYDIPLGVVFVRESIREAMKKGKFRTTKLEELRTYIMENFSEHYRYFEDSKVFSEKRKQKKLGDFL